MWAFRRRQKDLSEEQARGLDELFQQIPELEFVYHFRWGVTEMFDEPQNREEAASRLEDYRKLVSDQGEEAEALLAFFRTYDEHRDGILAYFGAPLAGSDDAERAVACGIAMQRKMEEFNKEQQRLNIPELMMGIGIDTGEVVVGNIGSEKRAKYSAMGSPVNTAYRIESSTVGGQVLISASTFEKVRSILKIDRVLKVPFKGLAKPVTLYEVKGIDGNYPLSMPKKKSDAFIKLETPLTISCFSLEGKAVSEKSIQGHITNLGKTSAEVLLSEQVDVYSNLKILPDPQKVPGANEIYAKVVSLDKSDSFASKHIVRLEFTYLSEDFKVYLEKRRSGR